MTSQGFRAGRSRRAVLIGNLRSRQTASLFAKAQRLLTEGGLTIAESHTVRDEAGLRKRVSQAVRRGYELIIVGGGDGSLTSAVRSFAHQEAVLGVLPFGTGNSFALSLGITPTVEHAVETILHGRVARVDLGVVNDTYFANFATIGLSSDIARNTSTLSKKILGPVAYVLAGIGPMLRATAFDATLKWDREKTTLRTHQLIVANGRYYGHVPLIPQATILDRKLAVFTSSDLNRWDVARMFIAFFFGKQTQLAEAEYFCTTELTVKTKPRQNLDVDGEALGTTPARFSVAPAALRVMVPVEFDGYQ